MKVRPIGKSLVGNGKVIAYFHHNKKSIIITDKDWVTAVHLEYPGFELILPKPLQQEGETKRPITPEQDP
jgi:hypothetical protein